MGKYRKKPVVIEAYQWFKENPIGNDVILMDSEHRVGDMIFVGMIKTIEDTEESMHYVCDGDWIITGIKGKKYACKDSIFKETYEEVING